MRFPIRSRPRPVVAGVAAAAAAMAVAVPAAASASTASTATSPVVGHVYEDIDSAGRIPVCGRGRRNGNGTGISGRAADHAGWQFPDRC